jgi:tetratricopeptide (TPR) repeat protein
MVAGVHLADALFWSGRGDEALVWAAELVARAMAAGDRRAILCARLQEAAIASWREPQGASERLEGLLNEAEPELAAAEDEYGLFLAARVRGHIANFRGRFGEVANAFDEVAKRGLRAGLNLDVSGWQAVGRYLGPTPLPELLGWIDRLDRAQTRGPYVRSMYAGALAMSGRLDEARTLLAALLEELNERGNEAEIARVQRNLAMRLEELAGDPEAAAVAGQTGCVNLEERGDRSILSTAAPRLARVLCQLGRLDEAEYWAEKGRELGAGDNAETQFGWRQAMALVGARRGEAEEATRLAREAVLIALETDMLNDQGDVYFDLGEVLALSGNSADAGEAYDRALDCYERKGNIVSASRTRERRRQLAFAAG